VVRQPGSRGPFPGLPPHFPPLCATSGHSSAVWGRVNGRFRTHPGVAGRAARVRRPARAVWQTPRPAPARPSRRHRTAALGPSRDLAGARGGRPAGTLTCRAAWRPARRGARRHGRLADHRGIAVGNPPAPAGRRPPPCRFYGRMRRPASSSGITMPMWAAGRPEAAGAPRSGGTIWAARGGLGPRGPEARRGRRIPAPPGARDPHRAGRRHSRMASHVTRAALSAPREDGSWAGGGSPRRWRSC